MTVNTFEKIDGLKPGFVNSSILSLSDRLMAHLFSFLLEIQQANLAGCHPRLNSVKVNYDKNYREKRMHAWERILTLIPKKISVIREFYSMRISETELLWNYVNEFNIYNMSQQSIKSIPCIGKKNLGGPSDERVSVYIYKNPGYRNFIASVVDNVTYKELRKIKLDTPYNIIAVYGTKKLNQTLEFISENGEFFECDYSLTKREMDQKKSIEEDEPIDAAKKSIPFFATTKNHQKLEKVYKINESYYFLCENNHSDRYVTYMKDNNSPPKQIATWKIIVSAHCADENFFYLLENNVLAIYKAGNVWERIKLKDCNPDFHKMIYPSNGGLVIKESATKIPYYYSTFYFLNYRKKILKLIRIGERRTTIGRDNKVQEYIFKDLLIFNDNDDWNFYYTPLNKKIFTLNLAGRELLHLMFGENQFFPVNLAICHSKRFSDVGKQNVFTGADPQLDVYSPQLG